MNNIVVKAPAKLNLFLKVLNKRPDGYHTIETLFEKIALFDSIKIEKRAKGIEIYSDNKELPKGRENLALRSIELLEDRFKLSLAVRIEIEKSIPIGAGLGGGSSDAAAVLMGIDRLYNMGLSKNELKLLAKELGADVPFFISKSIWAIGRERGDEIEGIDTQIRLWHILIIPPFFILSGDAYKWIDGRYENMNLNIDETLFALREGNIGLLGRNLYNALEGISLEKESLLKTFKRRLVEWGAKGAIISGSGPALFGIVEDNKEVVELKTRIEEEMQGKYEDWQVLVVPTL